MKVKKEYLVITVVELLAHILAALTTVLSEVGKFVRISN